MGPTSVSISTLPPAGHAQRRPLGQHHVAQIDPLQQGMGHFRVDDLRAAALGLAVQPPSGGRLPMKSVLARGICLGRQRS